MNTIGKVLLSIKHKGHQLMNSSELCVCVCVWEVNWKLKMH